MKHQIGLVGLAVMGQNLALNIAEHGFSIAVYNRSPEKTDEFMRTPDARRFPVEGYRDLKAFVESIKRPRAIILLVKAGEATDATIESLAEFLEPGDLIIDGGNAYYKDTERRNQSLAARGIHFFGMGVSGGEKGARNGPSLMPGGQREGWERMRPILEKIAAQVDDGPCVTYLGPGSSGHYVKMVHNGIEYGDMQLISEAYDLLHRVGGLTNQELGTVFQDWNKPGSELESYLIEITGLIFEVKDSRTGGELIDQILDAASMKGTGKWTVQDALDRGAPVPTIAASVDGRVLSSMKAQRVQASQILSGPALEPVADRNALINDIKDALFASKVLSYTQGMALLKQASDANKWDLNIGEVSRIWKGGCIIRSWYLLDRIKRAYQRNQGLANLLLDEEFSTDLNQRQAAWRRVITLAVQNGIPVPAMSASLAYFDTYRTARLPANLIQAQRDFFGAHTFQRVDAPDVSEHYEGWGE